MSKKNEGIIWRKDGYVAMRIGTVSRSAKGARYKLVHRIIAEKMLGRPLRRDEIVHHKNEDRSDNAPENLEITTQAHHAKIHYATREKNEKGQLV